jgi:hypothetical protein
MQFSPFTVHLSVQRATTKSVSTSNFQRQYSRQRKSALRVGFAERNPLLQCQQFR